MGVSIYDIINMNEVDDQFLRLKEVLGCSIKWTYAYNNSSGGTTRNFDWNNITDVNMSIFPDTYFFTEREIPQNKKKLEKIQNKLSCVYGEMKYLVWDIEYLQKILNEIDHIKYRVETMYPVKMVVKHRGINIYPNDRTLLDDVINQLFNISVNISTTK